MEKAAIRDIATNNGQCRDLGRKKALEILSKMGRSLSKHDLDCADLASLSLSQHTNLSKVSMARANARGANFSGVDINGSLLSGTDFSNADFSNTSLAYSVLGRHLLFDERTGAPRCYAGANLTGANLENANLLNAYLVGVQGLTCEQLRSAKNWPYAARDKELACEALIPDLSLYDYIKKWPQKCE